jgi:hypothetical protein
MIARLSAGEADETTDVRDWQMKLNVFNHAGAIGRVYPHD